MTAYTMNNEKKAMRELSMEEMDRVNGGGTIEVEGAELTEEQFNIFILSICDNLGYSTAVNFFQASSPITLMLWRFR